MKRAFLLVFALSCLAFAIPRQINYQGKLTDSTGVALNGPYTMVFRIYDSPSGGTALWSETHDSVFITKGLFDVVLGETTPLDLPFDRQYYLEVEVDGEVLSPRIPMASVGYAFRALWSDSVDWGNIAGVPSDFADGVDDVDDADNVVGNEYNTSLSFDDASDVLSLTDGGGTLTAVIDNEADDLSDNSLGDLGDVDLSGGVSVGQVLKWNGSVWLPADDEAGTGGIASINGQTGPAITINGGTGIAVSAASNTITITNTGDTNPSDDLTTSTTFSGDVSGTYDDLQLGTGVVGNAEISNSTQFVDVYTDGTLRFSVTDGDQKLNLIAGTGIDISYNASNHDVTITHEDRSSQGSVNNSNGTVIQDVSLDWSGHVTGLASVNLDNRYARGSGSTNYLVKWTGTRTVGTSQLYDNGTNVGLGDTSPDAKFDVQGKLRISNGNYLVLSSSDGGDEDFGFKADGENLFIREIEDANKFYMGFYDDSRVSIGVGSEVLSVTGSKVGIRTTSPKRELDVNGTVRIRPPLAYKKTTTTYTIPNSSEGSWIDDPMGAASVTIYGPSTLWIVYRGRIYARDDGTCGNAHSYGYSRIKVGGTAYGESKFAWEVSTGEGSSAERGFISTLLVDVTCGSYPCTITVKGQVNVHDGNCPCVFGGCDVKQRLAERNLFVEVFRKN